MTLRQKEVEPIPVKDILTLKGQLDDLMNGLDNGAYESIYFGKRAESFIGQHFHAIGKLNTRGGLQYRVYDIMADSRTGSGSYHPLTPEGRAEAIADVLERAMKSLFALRLHKRRFPTIRRIQQQSESDFSFFAVNLIETE